MEPNHTEIDVIGKSTKYERKIREQHLLDYTSYEESRLSKLKVGDTVLLFPEGAPWGSGCHLALIVDKFKYIGTDVYSGILVLDSVNRKNYSIHYHDENKFYYGKDDVVKGNYFLDDIAYARYIQERLNSFDKEHTARFDVKAIDVTQGATSKEV